MATNTTTVQVVLEAVDKATATFNNVGKNFDQLGSKATQLGGSLTKGLTLPIAAVGTGAVLAATQVEKGTSQIIKSTGAVGDELKEMEDIMRNVTKEVPQGFEEVGTAIAELNTRMGSTGDELQKNSKLLLDYARVHNLDVGPAVQGLGRMFNALDIEASEVPFTLDKITRAAQLSGIQADRLVNSIVEAGPAFETLGFDMDRSIALFAQFEKVGARPEEIISSMGMALNTMAKEGEISADTFNRLIGEIKEADFASSVLLANELFGARAGAKIAEDIRAGNFEIEEMLGLIQDAEGVFQNTADASLTFNERMAMMRDRVTLAAEPLGTALMDALEGLLPILEKAFGFVEKLFTAFGNLPKPVQIAVIGFFGLLAALGPLLIVAGTLIKSVGTIIALKATLAGTTAIAGIALLKVAVIIGAVIAIIWLLFKAGQWIIKNWDNIKETAGRVWDFIKTVVSETWETIKKVVKVGFDFIKGLFKMFMDAFLPGWRENWQNIKDVADAFMVELGTKIDSGLQRVKDFWNNVFNGMGATFNDVVNSIGEMADRFLGPVIRMIERASDALNSLRNRMNIGQRTKSIFSGMGTNIVDSFKAVSAEGSRSVNDALITSDGKVIEFNKDDDILASKNMGGIGGGGLTVNVSNNTIVGGGPGVGRIIAEEVMKELRRSANFA